MRTKPKITLRRGVFAPFIPAGTRMYSLPAAQRHYVILSAIARYNDPRGILRRLVALRTLNKNRNPQLAQKVHKDVQFVQKIRERIFKNEQ